MPETTTYYRSEHPAVTAWWERLAQAQADFQAQVAVWEAEYPGFRLVIQSGYGWRQALGLSGEANPGPPWMVKKGDTGWTPRFQGRGKDLQRRLWATKLNEPELPGLPQRCPCGFRVKWPTRELLGGVTWIGTHTPEAEILNDPAFDPAIWQRARASEYWIAKERAEGAVTAP